MKRGQATIFVILGIIIATAVALSYSYKDEISAKASELGITKTAAIKPAFKEKQAAVETCLREMLDNAVTVTSSQGGYAGIAPQDSLMFGYLPIAYHYDQGESKVPPKEEIAAEIARLLQNDAPKCAITIEADEPKKATAKVKIEAERISAQVSMPIKVAIGESTETISAFQTSNKARLGKILDTVKAIADQQASDPESTCLSCINNIALQNEMEVEMQQYQGVPVLTITDKKSEVGGAPLEFAFAMRH